MFARVTWFQSPPDGIDAATSSYQQNAAPALAKMPGNVGTALLIDRATGAGAAISYWDSQDSLQASEERAGSLRAQVAAEGSMTVGDIDRFDVIIQERSAPAAANTFVRLNDLRVSPDKIESVANIIRETLPTLTAQKGFRAVLAGANRQTGRMFVGSVWATAADREASDAAVKEQRGKAAQAGGADTVKLDLYDVAYADIKQATRA